MMERENGRPFQLQDFMQNCITITCLVVKDKH